MRKQQWGGARHRRHESGTSKHLAILSYVGVGDDEVARTNTVAWLELTGVGLHLINSESATTQEASEVHHWHARISQEPPLV